MDVDAYLRRIGMTQPGPPSRASLEKLQRAHLTAVPFENLDVYGRKIVKTDDTWTVSKVVDRARGGWCFELNGAFASLLAALGYEVTRLAATVLNGAISPIPTHLTLEVTLERPYLVDVGFGESFIKPLPLDSEGPHDGGIGAYGFDFSDDLTTLISWDENGDVARHYRFGREPGSTADFEEASTYLRTTPGLRWTESRFATRLIDGGPDRVTLLSDRIKFRKDGFWDERRVGEEEWDRLLFEWFGLTP